MNQIWNERRGYRQVIVDNNTPVLPVSLRFLFCLRKIEDVASELVPSIDGTWQGTKLSKIEYKGAKLFVFSRPKLKATPFIPDFMHGNPLYFNPVDFRTICL